MRLQTLSLGLKLFDWNPEVWRAVLNVGAFLEAEASSAEASSAELTTASVWEGCGDGQPDFLKLQDYH